MGLGKTYVGSEKLKELSAPYNLLVCQKSKIKDWAEHFKGLYDFEVVIFKGQPIESIPSNVILLSGTPTGGKYEELWSQLRLLGWNITKKLFYKHYTIVEKKNAGGLVINVVTGYKNVDRLKEKLKSHGALFMKTEDVFDLPGQIETTIHTASTPDYKRFTNDRAVTVGSETLTGDSPLARLLYQRQLASIYNKSKHQALIDTLKSSNDRFVIFYNFKREFEIIKNICRELDKPLSYISGEGVDLENYENEANSIILVQYQAGASGVNLQRANKIVYFSLTLSAELWMQSKKRIHRIGQSRCCFYYYLITTGSVEEKILEVLKERRDFTVELFEKEMAVSGN